MFHIAQLDTFQTDLIACPFKSSPLFFSNKQGDLQERLSLAFCDYIIGFVFGELLIPLEQFFLLFYRTMQPHLSPL